MTQSNSIDRESTELESRPDELFLIPSGTEAGPQSDNESDDADDDSQSAALTARQQQALEWLMSGGTITEAAELVGVKRQTVSRWVNHHFDFSCLYQAWQERVKTSAEARIMGLADAAIDNLIAAVCENRDVKASQFVLKLLGIASRKHR